jgi:multiple sugar transport system ATP-binding protein
VATLSVRNITKSFGANSVARDVTLEVADGELFVLIGPSGSGKTTILRIVAGLEPADGGNVLIGSRDVTHVLPAARNVGMVFQSYALFPHLTVHDNIAFGLVARRAPAAEIARMVGETAAMLRIEALLARLPLQLSGGERQRVALARALVRHPDVLLMDEPLSNLDAQLRAHTRTEIVRVQASVGTTTLYVTHDQVEALSMGHRIGVLRDGALEQVGTPQDIYERPVTLFVARFIGTPPMRVLEADADRGVITAGPIRIRAGTIHGRVLVGVRPEHVHVAGSRWSAHVREGGRFPVTVEHAESVGDQAFLTLIAGDHRLTARVEPSFRPSHGEQLDAWLDTDRIHVFDATSERALRGAS